MMDDEFAIFYFADEHKKKSSNIFTTGSVFDLSFTNNYRINHLLQYDTAFN